MQFKPKDYQKLIAHFIAVNPRCSIWASMGMGKTSSTLTAITHLDLMEDVYPVLILAPLRVAKNTWPAEVRKWDHTKHLRVSPIVGTVEERRVACARKADIYTTNYDNLVWLVEYYGERWPFKMVVSDEATRLKSFRLKQGGVRAQALSQVAFSRIKRFVELTGTPAPNGLADLWGQLWFIDGGKRLGRTFTAFMTRWFGRNYDGYGSTPFKHAQDEIQSLLKDVCLTVDAKDYFDLNEPIVKNLTFKLPVRARKLYDEMEKDLFMELEGHEVEAFNAAAKTQKLLQICSGAVYVDPLTEGDGDKKRSKEWKLVHDEKLDILESIVEESGGMPVLVAYHFKSDLARLLKRFPKGRLLDSNPQTEDEWNAGKIPVLFAHPACLHPDTEVLTELRGWVKLIEVKKDDKVFDGVEFVAHSGCSYSGYESVIDVFGITMTLNHRLLIDNAWVEAKDVRTDTNTREKACYSYPRDGSSLSKMFELQSGKRNTSAEFCQTQSQRTKSLQPVYPNDISPNDRHPVLEYMEGNKIPYGGFNRQELWGSRYQSVPRMVRLQKLLQRYVQNLRDWIDYRAGRCERFLQQRELSVGYQYGATSEQEKQQVPHLPRGEATLSRGMPSVGGEQDEANISPRAGNDSRGSDSSRESVHVRDEQPSVEKAHVYDLVDCGPRHRFLVRNSDGEMFISHNSAGHGLNLQYGGNILVFFSHDWNLENRLQIIERIGPMRQLQAGLDRLVFIYNIVAENSADEMVIARVDTKREVQDILLEAMKRRRTDLNKEIVSEQL